MRWRRTAQTLVPLDEGRGRALGGVVCVLAFLAALTAGFASIVAEASHRWGDTVARESTALVRPSPGRDLEADVANALAVIRGQAGIREAYALPATESRRLLEPWLGGGLDVSDLPIPRLIVLKPVPDARLDIAALGRRLREAVPTASTDDAAGWTGRLTAGARAVVAGALALLGVVLAACAFAVALATRSAVVANRDVIDVLHLMGASDGFVAGQVVRRFLTVGIVSGAIGSLAAAACVAALAYGFQDIAFEPADGVGAWDAWFTLKPSLVTGAVALAVAAMTATVSWMTVQRFLREMR